MPTKTYQIEEDTEPEKSELLKAFYEKYGEIPFAEDRAEWLIALGAFTLGWEARKEQTYG